MKAVITGESERVGVKVQDNNSVDHGIEMDFDGTIKYHEQDGYPDKPAERTPEENERVSQARRYAAYYVAQETDYDVLSWDSDQRLMKQARTAIESLSSDEFEQYFGTYFDQINSRLPGVSPPVDEPKEVGNGEFVLYLLDVYLDATNQIEATSDIHFLYLDDQNEKQLLFGEQPVERDPDVRLQLTPNYLPSVDVGQEFFTYHLTCQIRDCYLLRGQEPPEEYRVIGPGLYEGVSRYLREDRPYLPYHRPHAEIQGYSLEFDYGFGDKGKQMAKVAWAAADNESDV